MLMSTDMVNVGMSTKTIKCVSRRNDQLEECIMQLSSLAAWLDVEAESERESG